MGAWLHDLDRSGAGRAWAWQPRLGRAGQLLFLDRPGEGHRRRYPDAADPVRRPQGAGAARRLRESALRSARLAFASAARQRSGKLAHRLLMPFVSDLREISGDLKQHALVWCDLPRTFLPDAFVEVADRRAPCPGDLKQPAGRYPIDPALVFVRLLIGNADHLGELLLGQAQHDAALANPCPDMIVDGGSRPPSFRLSHAPHLCLSAQNALIVAFIAINAIATD